MSENKEPAFIDVVFDGPPGPEAGRFVEVENERGESIKAGEWIDRGDRMWALRIQRDAGAAEAKAEAEQLRTRIDSLTKSFRDQMVRDAANDAVIVRQRKEIVALRQGAPSFQIRLREDGAFDVVDPAGFIKDAVPARELAEALMTRVGEQGPG